MSCRTILMMLFLSSFCVNAAQINGRISVLGNVSNAHRGDIGDNSNIDVLNADQQSFRLMLDGSADEIQWSFHLNSLRQHVKGLPVNLNHSSDLFRFFDFSHSWSQQRNTSSSTQIGYELDHAYLKHDAGNFTLSLGRQPVDWGSGRFWQPMNLFGAFAPTDLDTEYKPGIDTAIVNWYPGAFSSLEAVYALAPHDEDEIKNSSALYYRRQVGQNSEMAVVAGSLFENVVYGASFESDWKGAGWRIEGVYYDFKENKDHEWFWIAGLDYQFNDGTLISTEWYNNGLGVSQTASLDANKPLSLFDRNGLKQHLSRQILGISANRDITPLLNANYSLLISPLKNNNGQHEYSVLHQFNLVYSSSDESEFVFSLQHATGKGLNQNGIARSEFGHLPDSLTLIYRHYF